MIPVKQVPRYYFVELLSAMGLFMVALFWRHAFAATHPAASLLKTIVLLSPILPVCLAAWAICRLYARTDEMLRKAMLENIAFGALFCAVGSIALGFLHDVGLPKVGIQWAWPLIGAGWVLICIYRGTRYALEVQGFARTAKVTLLVAALVGLPTLTYALIAPAMGWPHKVGFIFLFATALFLLIVGFQTFRKDKACE
jgi:hypothetical protein